jgi:hypothetical protein
MITRAKYLREKERESARALLVLCLLKISTRIQPTNNRYVKDDKLRPSPSLRVVVPATLSDSEVCFFSRLFVHFVVHLVTIHLLRNNKTTGSRCAANDR